MKTKVHFLLILLFSFAACNNDDDDQTPAPITPADNRVLVINEGNFGQANGTITEINTQSLEVTQDIIGEANNGVLTGDVAQSAYVHDGKIYVVVNVDGKVLILDANSYEQTAVIESELSNPRYLEIHDGKIYVTNWNSDFTTSYVAVFEENSLDFLYKIDTDPGTERIHFDGTRFWVSNSFTNTVQTFLPDANSIENTYQLESGPNGIAEINDRLVVICQNFSSTEGGAIYEFDKSQMVVTDTFNLPFTPGPDILSNVNRFFFFNSGGQEVYESQLNDSFDPQNARIVMNVTAYSSIYSLDVSPEGNLWIGDAKGFTEAGRVYQYEVGGNFIRSYETGIGPSYFIFF